MMNWVDGHTHATSGAPVSDLKRPFPFDDDSYHYPATNGNQDPNAAHSDEPWYQEITQRLCLLGSIIDVQAQPCNAIGLSIVWDEAIDPYFNIVQEGDYFALELWNVKFGRLSKGICKYLQALAAHKQVSILGYTSGRIWMTAIHSWLQHSPTLLSMEINVYATRENAKEVGTILAHMGIFLQWPRYGREGFEYYNPHFLRIDGFSDCVPTETLAMTKQKTVEIPDNVERVSQGNDSEIVHSILDSLSHHVQLKDVSAIPDVKSTLLDHQKEAVDFVWRRETGQTLSEQSLWKYNNEDNTEPFYQHVFTGAKRPEQVEVRGGIIADEMGLGKTLVMLSTVAASLDRANDFVAAENQLRVTQPLRKAPSRATLIIVPAPLLIDNWRDEIRKHANPGALTSHKHLGSSRHDDDELPLLYEKLIVFTTYSTLAREFRERITSLSNINWFRIILDEAHDIRNRSTQQFQAVANISAQHRWCLTGTPIQNSLDDLGALISFLKMPLLEKPQTFRKFITNPISSHSKNRFQNLQTLLQSVCLRRTRDLLDLPEPITHYRRVALSLSEQAEYNDLLRQCKRDIDMAMRLFCNNGRAEAILRPGPNGLPEDLDEAWAYLQQHGQNICAFCSGTIYSISEAAETDGGKFLTSCHHLVCHSCSYQKRAKKKDCPSCASADESTSLSIMPPTKMLLAPGDDEAIRTTNQRQYPSKLLQLLADISKEPHHKSIVFSCWKKTLNIVSKLLTANGLGHYVIDGSLPNSERVEILNNFRAPTGANILLMTLGTGAVGLNLAVASRVYLLEPQWNPSIEAQAIGRALRLGQTDHVVILRYIMKGTVEESNVLNRQKRKLELAGGGFSKEKDLTSDRFQALLDVFGVDDESSS
ncbi:matrix-associated actin-dependent regulator [Paramyrothecium foliicola]|nr:matrix-associated actin-dependent regulator [Paramyrothecium foliicola]